LQAAQQVKQQDKTDTLLPLLWMHDERNPVGSILSATETPAGLLINCQCDMDTEAGRAAFSGIQKGYAKGLSIGYNTVKSSVDSAGVRHLLEVKLWEISVVTTGYAANPLAMVDSASAKARKDSTMPQDDDWKLQRLPRMPYRSTTPAAPEIPIQAKFATRDEFETARAKWYEQVYGLKSTSTRRVYENDEGLTAVVPKSMLDRGDVKLIETEVVEVVDSGLTATDRTDEAVRQANERASRPGASIVDIRDYYKQHGRTPDGRVVEDVGDIAQQGYQAALRLMDDARKGR